MIEGRDLAAEILAEQARLDELDRHRDTAQRRLQKLRAAQEGVNADGANAEFASSSRNWSPERKLELFASLFRGRPDVFPRRWESTAKGRSGWAPRCANEWKAGVCEKPRVKCG